MTKVQLKVKLYRSLDDDDLKQIARVHSVLGIFAARVLPGDELFVEYDASRLTRDEVRETLEAHGLPLL